jgi:signal transduction histidine kinase
MLSFSRSRPRLSLSIRLTLWYGASLLILLSVFVIFLYTSLHLALHRDFDEQLRSEKQMIEPAIQLTPGGPSLTPSDHLRSVAYQTDGLHGTFVRLLSQEGRILYSSPNFEGHAGFAPSIPPDGLETTRNHNWEGAPARTLYSPIMAPGGERAGWLEITRLESTIHRELHRLGWLLGVGIIFGVFIAAVSGHWLARRALSPVAALTSAARRLGPTDLGSRLPTGTGVRDELSDLADTFNAFLERLQDSFERERRFRADAAHEMFTPLSAVQSEVDVALRKRREQSAYEGTLDRIGIHARRMAAVLDELLELSRAESLEPSNEAANLSDAASTCLERIEPTVQAAGVDLRCRIDDRVFVYANRMHLEQVVSNLLDNAVKYTPAGGTVSITVTSTDDEGILRIEDTGIGFDEDEGRHLFDRFFRSSRDAVQKQRGSGLGLPIVHAIVEAYGGTIDAASAGQGQGSTFTVRLPASSPVPAEES